MSSRPIRSFYFLGKKNYLLKKDFVLPNVSCVFYTGAPLPRSPRPSWSPCSLTKIKSKAPPHAKHTTNKTITPKTRNNIPHLHAFLCAANPTLCHLSVNTKQTVINDSTQPTFLAHATLSPCILEHNTTAARPPTKRHHCLHFLFALLSQLLPRLPAHRLLYKDRVHLIKRLTLYYEVCASTQGEKNLPTSRGGKPGN